MIRLRRAAVHAAIAGAASLGMILVATGPAQAGQEPAAQTLDARAVATVSGGIGVTATWFTGTVAPGGTQTWTWNNAAANHAFIVGYNPSGASTTATCQFETTTSRYLQQPGGEREFQFTLRNAGSISCGATVLLTSLGSFTINGTGGMGPGEAQTHLWNIAAGTTFVAGLNPHGATSSTACQIRVTRSWYVQPSSGLRQFWFTVQNVGSITCQADLQLGSTTGGSSFSHGHINAGASVGKSWNNANPVTSAYLLGLSPASASPNQCQQEVTRLIYRQRINTDGSSERELGITLKNVGTVGCGGLVNLPRIAA